MVAHEIGHGKHQHKLKTMLASFLLDGFIWAIFSLFIENPAALQSFGLIADSPASVLLMAALWLNISEVLKDLIYLKMRRIHEYQADHFSWKMSYGSGLISFFKKLVKSSIMPATSHPFYIINFSTHPTPVNRVLRLKQLLHQNPSSS